MVISRALELCREAWPGVRGRSEREARSHGRVGWGVAPLLLPGNLQEKEMSLIHFPLWTSGKRAKLRAEYTNKTKDLTLRERKKKKKKPIPRVEMWYSPACPLSALWDPLPAALHSWVSSLKSELQESVNAARAAPAAPLCCPWEQRSATTRVMQPGQVRAQHGSRRQRITHTWQG